MPTATTQLRFKPQIQFVIALVVLAVFAVALAACGDPGAEEPVFDPQSSVLAKIEFSSPAFKDGDSIPTEFTCDGDDSSPPLRWSDVPADTRALAIVIDDPDAPGRIFRHWSVYNIPSGKRSLEGSQPTTGNLENSTLQGLNDFERIGYGGPCPPKGQEHEYLFFIYALSEPLELDSAASPGELTAAIRGRVLGTGSFTGMYVRR